MYFVSNVFVEKVFDQIMNKQHQICDFLESKINILTDKVQSVEDVRDIELPEFEKKIKFNQMRLKVVANNIVRSRDERRFRLYMKLAWKSLIAHRDKQKHEAAKVGKLMNAVRKFILYHTFRQYAKKVSLEVQI